LGRALKLQSVAAFEKHLHEAFPDHISPVYLVVTSCDFERKKMVEKITQLLLHHDARSHLEHFDGEHASIEAVLGHLNTRSLFGGQSLAVVDRIVKSDPLLAYLQAPNPEACLILASPAMKPAADLYQKGKKEMVVLDLSEEKPWERQRRLQEWLLVEAKKEGKVLQSDALGYLFENVGPDMPGLHQEFLKTLCYVGERAAITLKDVQAISPQRSLATAWQLAEGVVWGKEAVPEEKTSDVGFLLMFLGQLRYHFQTGLRLAEYLEKKLHPAEIARQFPTLRSHTLEKYVAGAKAQKKEYFRRGLTSLFELEFALKSSPAHPALLFDRWIHAHR